MGPLVYWLPRSLLLAMVVATVYANVNGPIESNDHADGSDPSHSSKVTYTIVTSNPFEAEATNVEYGGRPPPGLVNTSAEAWGSKEIVYLKWTGSKWKTVRTAGASGWYDLGEPGDLHYINDSTDVSLPGGALVKHRNQYGWLVQIFNNLDWSSWSSGTHKHFLEHN